MSYRSCNLDNPILFYYRFDKNLNFFIEKECYSYAKEYNVFDEELEKMILKIYNQIKPFISEIVARSVGKCQLLGKWRRDVEQRI